MILPQANWERVVRCPYVMQKQRKEQQKLIEALKTGDKVVTSAGIHGLIANVKEKTVLLKVADNVKIEIDKAAVATVLERSSDESAS